MNSLLLVDDIHVNAQFSYLSADLRVAERRVSKTPTSTAGEATSKPVENASKQDASPSTSTSSVVFAPTRRRPAAPSGGCCRCTAVKGLRTAEVAAAAAAACGALVSTAGKHSTSGAWRTFDEKEDLGNRSFPHIKVNWSFNWSRGRGGGGVSDDGIRSITSL